MKRFVSGILLFMMTLLCAAPALGDVVAVTPYLTVTSSVRVAVNKSKATNFSTNASFFEAGSEDSSIATVSADGKTITGVGVGETVIVFSGYFPQLDQTIVKQVAVTVTSAGAWNDPYAKFFFSPAIRQRLLKPGADAPMAFALSNLVIRNSSGDKVGALAQGEAVAITGATTDGRMLVLTGSGLHGSVITNGLARFSEAEAVARVANPVNMRLGPSVLYDCMDTLPADETVSVLTTDDRWSLVHVNGTVGYVASSYLTKDAIDGASASGITVLNDKLTVVVGETAAIEYTVNDPTATFQGLKADWVCVNKNIATIEKGVVKGIKIGETYACATDLTKKVHLINIRVVSSSAAAETGVIAPSADASFAKYVVTTDELPVREGPGVSYSVTGALNKNATVYGQETAGGKWVYLMGDSAGAGGYASRKYLAIAE